jgi:hypothetical protein
MLQEKFTPETESSWANRRDDGILCLDCYNCYKLSRLTDQPIIWLSVASAPERVGNASGLLAGP